MPRIDVNKLEQMFNLKDEQNALHNLVPPTLPVSFDQEPLQLSAENIADILQNFNED